MRILIDGCDGTGKTTISEKLANKLGCNIIRLTYNGDRSEQAYVELMECENVVHDRTFLSEIIYPKYFGRESRLGTTFLSSLLNFIERNKVKVFILTAKPETILERIDKRGDEFIADSEKFIQINLDYLSVAKECGFTVIDTTNKTIDEIIDEMLGEMKNDRR